MRRRAHQASEMQMSAPCAFEQACQMLVSAARRVVCVGDLSGRGGGRRKRGGGRFKYGVINTDYFGNFFSLACGMKGTFMGAAKLASLN